MKEINSEIKQVIFRLGIAYAFALVILSFSAVWINNIFHNRLAIAFGESAHNSIVSGDLRQAITILNPALNSHFSSVSLLNQDGTVAFSLPFESKALSEMKSLWSSSIYYRVETSPGTSMDPNRVLRFTFNWASPIIYILAIWAAMLSLAFPIFRRLKERIEARHNEILELRSAELMNLITSQVSHDIRSPLAALNNLLNSGVHIEIESPILDAANNALTRINDIANQLLNPNEYKSHLDTYASLPTAKVIKQMVEEKIVESMNNSRITIRWKVAFDDTIFVSVPPIELSRILSNLMNNAIESIAQIGSIEINAYLSGSDCKIDVVDTGKGIPDEVVPQLGKKRFTFDKIGLANSGNGLGLYHADSTLKKYGGLMKVESVLGKGTLVSLQIPVISQVGSTVPNNVTIVIDNDFNIRQLWELVAKKKKRKVICFSGPNEFYSKASQFDPSTPIFIDVELDDDLRGEDVAVIIAKMGFSEIFLSTGHSQKAIAAPACVKGIVGKEPIFD
jgi:signal transduction histidine kinase